MSVAQLPDGLNLTDFRPRKKRNAVITRIDLGAQDRARRDLIGLFPDQEWDLDLDEDILRAQIFSAVATLAGLSRAERQVLSLECDPKCLTLKQIAWRRDCAVGTVKSLSFRARRKLAQLGRDLATLKT